ncbi:MAG TPA: hypothetical protein VHC41_01350 [Mycobacteriales bacterium]|nr:hypothetical protein [Mycobacteriales bacterium]
MSIVRLIEVPRASSPNYPMSMYRRLAALLGDDPVVYADHNLIDDLDTVKGRVVLLTARRVIMADADGLPSTAARVNNRTTCGLRVKTWARSTLQGIALEGAKDGPNSDDDWEYASDSWPRKASVTLTYADEELTLPLGNSRLLRQTTVFSAFLPGLLADLERPAS